MQNRSMFLQKFRDAMLLVISLIGAISAAGCVSFGRNESGKLRSHESLPLPPAAVALGSVDVLTPAVLSQLGSDWAGSMPPVIDIPEFGNTTDITNFVATPALIDQWGSMRARSTSGGFQTAGASALATSLEQLSNVYRMVNSSEIRLPAAETEKPSHALCGGSAIVVHENGGGLRAATLRLSEDIVIPFGTIWCGQGEITQVITLADQ